MGSFTIFPAIDLRHGQVVRLIQGDPRRETVFDTEPSRAARRWLDAGAGWLHVINLDGAFEVQDDHNRAALQDILDVAAPYGARVQFGGGLRSLEAVEKAFAVGVNRIILGTLAVERPEILGAALKKFGAGRILVGIDAREGLVKLSGWRRASGIQASVLARRLSGLGLRTAVYTDITRDGTGTGINASSASRLAQSSGLQIIASGGVNELEDIRQARLAGLFGIIIGRALYMGNFSLQEALRC